MDTQYFIDKFEAIPEEKWCIGSLCNIVGQSCANGHCGVRMLDNCIDDYPVEYFGVTTEGLALQMLFSKLDITCAYPHISYDFTHESLGYSIKAAIVNNKHALGYKQETPKQRILAALRDIQLLEMQEKAVQKTKEILAQPVEELV